MDKNSTFLLFRHTSAVIRRAIVFVLCGWTLGPAQAEVRMPAIFGDHMVLQQNLSVPVWGWADPGENVSVAFGEQVVRTSAGPDGKWRVNLARLPANSSPLSLTVTGKNTLKFDDVLVGDVWLCSGQSNMVAGFFSGRFSSYHGWLQKRGVKGFDTNQPGIRIFFVTKSGRPAPADTVAEAPVDAPLQGKWQVCSAESLRKLGDFTDQDEGGFSAVAYFFGREIHSFTGNPVGLIGSYVGGTRVDQWTSLAGLNKQPALAHYLEELKKPTEFYSTTWAEYVAAFKKWKLQVSIEAKPSESPPLRPRHPFGITPPPASLFNGMISPLIPYGIKGVIWYQGESNVGRAKEYEVAFSNLITDWRAQWKEGDFPFLFVQLPNCDKVRPEPDQKSEGWPRLRESQSKALALPNTGMAVTIDIGAEDIHPPDKYYLSQRLAQVAKKVAYGADVSCYGPTFKSAKIDDQTMRISFANPGSGLVIGSPPEAPDRVPKKSAELQGFSIAGADKKFVWAKAKIVGEQVVVWSESVPHPEAVRYNWAGNPIGNLYSQDELPAAPFRTDDW